VDERASLPSDFPAALGSLAEADLPVVSAGLPAPKGPGPGLRSPAAVAPARAGVDHADLPSIAADLPAPKAQPARAMAAVSFELDLPAPVAGLPAPKGGHEVVDLPVVAAALPAVPAGLPTVSAALPTRAAAVPLQVGTPPVPATGLSVAASALPSPARAFGEIDLPTVGESLPSTLVDDRHLPARTPSPPPPTLGASSSFGEIDLPRELPPGIKLSPPGRPEVASSGAAGASELQFEDRPRSSPSGSGLQAKGGQRSGGGMSYGELDLGGGDGAPAEAPIGVETALAPRASTGVAAAMPAAPVAQGVPLPTAARRERPAAALRKRSFKSLAVAGLFAAGLLAGAALQLTPYGAFGYLFFADRIYAGAYATAARAAIAEADRGLAADTYDAARAVVDAAVSAHGRTPRARNLTAFACFVDFATNVRFGPDASRPQRAKQLLSEMPPKEIVTYRDAALAAQLAAGDDPTKARKALEEASRAHAGDAISGQLALLEGNVDLAAKDGAAALSAFRRALATANDARAHFGLARAYDLLGDPASAKKELGATLAVSPEHAGALTLRARLESAPADEPQALGDLATVLEGGARAKASPAELSNAYAAKALVSLERGSASEAREAFARAIGINQRNVEALNGEGRLLLNEGRYTEALSRFDTALQCDPASPVTIANDAEAKLGLERLADAKQQLTDARQRFPRSIPVLLTLGKVEQHLGNNDAAEADLRAALPLVDPSRRDAVLPYVTLSELLSARGRLADAKAMLDEATRSLPPSGPLDRAFGEVAELQGDYDSAAAHYRSAIGRDTRDIATHFRLAVVLRRMRKFDDAGAELDRVAAVDRDYPGLALERGLLFEESGDVEKAIEQFKGALARAPDDPDLQLRVGSAYVAIDRPDDALPMLRKVLEKRPTSAEAHHYIGRALMLKGRSEQVDALRYLKRAVDLDPNRAEFHVYLAWEANEATPAQLELARDEIDRALALDKLNAEAYWQKAVLERMQGAIEDALKDARRALELRPSRYEAHATIAECYEDKNDTTTAAAEWARAIAGDPKVGPDEPVPHPYWRYKYGKLLLEHGSAAGGLAQLLPAALTAEKSDPRPGWLAPLEFLTAEALRKTNRREGALDHYRRFLEIAPLTSPDRADAQAALTKLSSR
jgi:tetratricopeptide (TPR) repeat protein